MSEFRLSIGHYGHPGQQRKQNQDSYLVLTAPILPSDIDALLVVADGMGGHQAGEVASRSLVELLEGIFRSEDYRNIVTYNPQHEDYYVVVIKEVLEWANEQLYQLSISCADLRGMGTTSTVALIAQGKCFWGHVGDSRAYLLNQGKFYQITEDHTWVTEQMRSGLLTPEEAKLHSQRHILTRSLAGDPLIRIDRDMFDLHIGDRLLLCSDGLTGVVQDREIYEVLASSNDPQHACDYLGVLANQRGAPDNITILTAYVVNDGKVRAFPSGRVLGPLPVTEVSTIRDNKPIFLRSRSKVKTALRQSVINKYLVFFVSLFFTALLSGLGMMFVAQVVSDELLPRIITAIVIFSWGAFVGRAYNYRN